MKSSLAEGMAQLGDLAGALVLIDEAIAQIGRPGWEERHYYAEALRIRGRLLSLRGDPAGAERAYIASLDWARTQQASSPRAFRRRTVREALASHSSHQANVPVIPSRQCTKSFAFSRASL
jgi:ATP/maltotriose-dependent transcriptional regulator MalT